MRVLKAKDYRETGAAQESLNPPGSMATALGTETLANIATRLLDLLGTSVTFFEANGDCAYGRFSRGWCLALDRASRRLAETDDDKEAMASGRWLCHESCWSRCSKAAIATGRPKERKCSGGMKVYAVPVVAAGRVIGAMCLATGAPPRDSRALKRIAEEYRIPLAKLKKLAAAYQPRPAYVVKNAKQQLDCAASMLGELVARRESEALAFQAHREMMEEKARAQTYFNIANVMLIVLDTNQQVQHINDRGCQVLERERKDIIGQNWFDRFVPPAEREEARRVFVEAMAGEVGTVEFHENSVLTSSWQEKRIAWRNAVLRDETGEITHLVSSGEDVTDQRRANEALEFQAELNRNLVESSPAFFVAVRPEGTTLMMNESMLTALGYEQDDVIGVDYLTTFVDANDRDLCASWIDTLLKSLDAGQIVLRMVARDGRRLLVEWRARTVMKAGRIDYFFGLGIDITKRWEAERALRIKDAAIESSINAIAIADPTGMVTYVNPAFLVMWGYDDDRQVIGRSVLEVCGVRNHDSAVIERMKGARQYVAEFPARRRDGVEFQVLFSGSLVTDPGGVPLCLMGSFVDISARKQMEQALRESESRYRAMFENLRSGVAVLQPIDNGKDFILTDFNESALRISGLTREQAAGAHLKDLFPGMEHWDVGPALERVTQTGKPEFLPNRRSTTRYGSGWRDWFFYRLPSGEVVVIYDDVTERMLAEHALRESERRYRLIAENAADIIWATDLELRLTYISPSVLRVRGFTVEEMLALDPGDSLPPSSLELALRMLAEELELEQTGTADPNRARNVELQEYRKDGTLIWTENEITFLRDEQGRAIGLIGVTRDITDRKNAEIALRESRQTLANVIDFLPDATFVVDQNGVVIAWNRAMETMTGVAASDILGRGDHEYSLPFYGHRRPILIDQVLGGETRLDSRYLVMEWQGQTLTGEAYAPALPGGARFLSGTAAALFDSNHNIVGAIESIRDITEKKEQQEALRESEARYRMLAENIRDIVWITSMSLQFVYLSPAVESVLGYSVDEFKGAPLSHITPPDSLELLKRILAEELMREDSPEKDPRHSRVVESQHRHKNGHLLWFESRITFLRGENGQPVGILGLSRDISDRKRAEEERGRLEEQLSQAQKMEAIGRLAGGIAHDFNNLLTGITGYTEMLMGSVRTEDPIYADLAEIKKATDRAASLTAQLLAFGRKQIINPRVVDLNELLGQSSRMVKRVIGEDVDFLFAPGGGALRVKADPGQIEQALINLAINARDAMPNGGRLTVETAQVRIDEEYCRSHPEAVAGQYIMIAVSDTGTGISEDVLPHLFEPFFTTKEKGKGTGLGLSMVYGIVRQNHGFINVYSEINRGTCFKIFLPAVNDEVTEEVAPEQISRSAGGETILLVEDEELVRNLAVRALERQQYRVLVADGAETALRLVNETSDRIDLLLSDVVMPRTNGRELYAQVKSIRPNVKVLFMSGYTEETITHRGVLESGTRFIQKPFSIDGLARAVREALDD